jgi:hypothetical protein
VLVGETARRLPGVSAEDQVLRLNSRICRVYEIIREAFHYAIACYCGFWRSGEARASSDALAAAWVSPAELQGFEFAPNVREAIARARVLLKL